MSFITMVITVIYFATVDLFFVASILFFTPALFSKTSCTSSASQKEKCYLSWEKKAGNKTSHRQRECTNGN